MYGNHLLHGTHIYPDDHRRAEAPMPYAAPPAATAPCPHFTYPVLGCGSLLGDLFYLADALLDCPSPAAGERGLGGDGLRTELYQMYGEGQIAEVVFTALRALADREVLRLALALGGKSLGIPITV